MSDSNSIPSFAEPPPGRGRALPRRPIESLALRSIIALILREMTTRFGRRPGGYAWAILQPLFLIIILGTAWSLLMRTPSLGTSFLLYKGTGLLIVLTFTNIGSVIGQGLSYSKSLLFYPGVTWVDALLARFVLNGLLLCFTTFIILAGIMSYEGIRTPLDWPKVLLAMGLTLALGAGMGVLNCYLFSRIPVYSNIWRILTAPLTIISGVIIHYEAMPELAQRYLWYNPLLHLTGIMRDGFYPLYRPDYISISYVMLWIMVPMVLGLLLVRKYNKDLINR